MDAMARVARGDADSNTQAMVRRFTEAMVTKATHGAEYYADPAAVRVGLSPRVKVHDGPWVELYHYDAGPDATPRQGPPVLIVYSVINRTYILDLDEQCSMIRHLFSRGLDVYLVEWKPAVTHDDTVTLDLLLTESLPGCLRAVLARTGAPKVSLFGHCIGGTLAAWLAALHPEAVDRLFLLTAPFAAPKQGLLAAWTDPQTFQVDDIVRTHGLMPGKLVRHTFIHGKPWLELMKWKMFVENLQHDGLMARFAVVDRWANDNVDVPGRLFAAYIHEVYQSDRCARGTSEFGGALADWRRIRCPVLHFRGADDWIAPEDSAKPWGPGEGIGGEVEVLPGGHLSLILDPRAAPAWEKVTAFLLGAAPA